MAKTMTIALSQAETSSWERRGLRGFLEYRDLGVAAATQGRFGATVGRAVQANTGEHAPLHYHAVGFHLTFVLRGWMRTYMEGVGEVVLKAGDCVTYEGENVQAHLESSDDFEVLQVTMPADYKTTEVVKTS